MSPTACIGMMKTHDDGFVVRLMHRLHWTLSYLGYFSPDAFELSRVA